MASTTSYDDKDRHSAVSPVQERYSALSPAHLGDTPNTIPLQWTSSEVPFS